LDQNKIYIPHKGQDSAHGEFSQSASRYSQQTPHITLSENEARILSILYDQEGAFVSANMIGQAAFPSAAKNKADDVCEILDALKERLQQFIKTQKIEPGDVERFVAGSAGFGYLLSTSPEAADHMQEMADMLTKEFYGEVFEDLPSPDDII